jgi:thiosulfate reductase cytochrome b subunit
MKQEQMIYHYPVYIRIWHLLNAVFMLVLILSGLSMQFSGPDGFSIPFSITVRMHNISGICLTASYLLFLIGNRISGNRKHYRIQWKGLKQGLGRQLRHYLRGYFRGDPPPYPVTDSAKFNPLQAVTYALSMYAGVPLVIITGWGLLFPRAVVEQLFGVNGLILTDLLHVIMGFLLTLFMIIHIYVTTIGDNPRKNMRSIITGWHPADEKNF